MLGARTAVVSLRSPKFVLLIIAFATVTAVVASGAFDDIDQSAVEGIASVRNPTADFVMISVTTSADLFPVYFSPIIIFAFILIAKKKTRRIGAILLLTLALSALVTSYAKQLIDRERPTQYEFEPDVGFEYEPQQDVVIRSASSFPSGHASRGAAFALIVSFLVRNRTLFGIPAGLFMWIYPASVAFSRVYIGVHYPTDVIGGIILGIIIANVISRILKLKPDRGLRA